MLLKIWTTRLPRYAFGILSARAQTLLENLERSHSMRTKVESLLVPILHTGHLRTLINSSRYASRSILRKRQDVDLKGAAGSAS